MGPGSSKAAVKEKEKEEPAGGPGKRQDKRKRQSRRPFLSCSFALGIFVAGIYWTFALTEAAGPVYGTLCACF
jgi:hypothetical protein